MCFLFESIKHRWTLQGFLCFSNVFRSKHISIVGVLWTVWEVLLQNQWLWCVFSETGEDGCELAGALHDSHKQLQEAWPEWNIVKIEPVPSLRIIELTLYCLGVWKGICYCIWFLLLSRADGDLVMFRLQSLCDSGHQQC